MRSKPPVVMLLDPGARLGPGLDIVLHHRGLDVRAAVRGGPVVLAAVRGELDAIVIGPNVGDMSAAEIISEIRTWDNTTAIIVATEADGADAIDQNWRTRVVNATGGGDARDILVQALRASSPRIDRWMAWRPWDAPALVLHDDEGIARSLEDLLKREAFEVHVTDLGEDAIDLASVYRYSVMLIDDALPDMSGFRVLRSIRSHNTHTPIFWLSCLMDVTGPDALAEGADELLQCPYDWTDLVQRVRAAASTGRRKAA